ncbi:MAG: O-antigen ligase family protein [Gammaproteobacteria bacterium]|jgi:O-antigen ligase|nr:O-antigen ligase family protein [Gammaproteobacteria bacterium]
MTEYPAAHKNSFIWLKDNLAVVLVLLAFLLFTSKSLYNYPVGIMALLGLFRLLRNPKVVLSNHNIRKFVSLFLCLWVPMLIALIDAVSLEHALHTVMPYIRFLFLGIYLISEIKTLSAQKALLLGLFCLVAFWCIDAVMQVLFTIDLFGYPYEARHITGMFYPKNTIAHICAGLSPLYFELIRQTYKQNKSVLLLLIPLFVVILISGRRATWVMLAISVSGYIYFLTRIQSGFTVSTKHLLSIALVLTMIMGAIVVKHEPINRRVMVTMGLFSGDYEAMDKATAKRLPLWKTAVYMARENWINGVGPRGFRHAYAEFTGDNDYWSKTGQTHPHQIILEILTESGIIGLLGLFIFLFLFYRFVAASDTDPPLFPWAWAVFVVIFPINTHMAFYGSYWSSFFWLLLVLCFVTANNKTSSTKSITQS